MSKHHRDLDSSTNRKHGLHRDLSSVPAKFSDEKIMVHSEGSFALIYKTMTGEILERSGVLVKNIIREIAVIGSELNYCGITPSPIAEVNFTLAENNGSRVLTAHPKEPWVVPVFQTPSVAGFALFKEGWNGNGPYTFKVCDGGLTSEELIGDALRQELCHLEVSSNKPRTLVFMSAWRYPQECSILLGLFILSSIARYDPVALDRLRQSEEWPVALALWQGGLIYIARVLIGFAFGNDHLISA